ncbi:hypothetical protein K505DRAFT_323560 [Melanomma pulvis-pyrius CBS 109.77]|uniref:Uncharacterized protein n=1 Tax=Melanomma pulvis-pyrius CBS 109.77 TaxID=1314802 RepID=A0A6A6XI32_9PLEO|nr:hypothetical protein K505DRAFT_323560 [Melanomma pulvis-pyrius CBS 109.77]
MLSVRIVARIAPRTHTPYPHKHTSSSLLQSQWIQKRSSNLPSSHFFSQLHPLLKPSPPLRPSKPATPSENPSPPSINIMYLLRDAKRPVRYTVLGALGIIATAECTFWIKVIQHKFFSPDEESSEEFFNEIWRRVQRYRRVWINAYGQYYSSTVWGV